MLIFEEEPVNDVLEESQAKKNKYTIQDYLAKLDDGEYDFYSKLDEADRKKVALFIIMRWMSFYTESQVDWDEARRQGRKKGDKKGMWPQKFIDNDFTNLAILSCNDFVNTKFFTLAKSHPDLVWKLLCIPVSTMKGFDDALMRKTKHTFIKKKNRSFNTPKLDELLNKIYPLASIDELETAKRKMTIEDVETFAYDMGKQDKYVKELKEEFANKYNDGI